MNYREKIKEAIKCPRLGNSSYGEWGALRYEQRVLIKRLLDELDDADNLILMLKKEMKILEEQKNNCIIREKQALDKINNVRGTITKEYKEALIEIINETKGTLSKRKVCEIIDGIK